MKKISPITTLLIICILVFFPVSSCSSVAITNQDNPYQPSLGTIITVDDDGDDDYTRIKDAANNADAGVQIINTI